jgi:hypothetical protein
MERDRRCSRKRSTCGAIETSVERFQVGRGESLEVRVDVPAIDGMRGDARRLEQRLPISWTTPFGTRLRGGPSG